MNAKQEKEAVKDLDGILVWHFLPEDGKLSQYGNPKTGKATRRVKVKAGQTVSIPKNTYSELGLCHWGYHGSERVIDALQFAPGTIVQRAVLHGEIIKGNDKHVATRRTCLWIADATETLHVAACWFAEQALETRRKAGDTIDPRFTAVIQAKRDWLAGKISGDGLDAAWDAARDAALGAPGVPVRAAARDAARAAALYAALDAALDAAGTAALDAVRDAARAAAWAAARAAAWDAARAAALYAAWDAALGAPGVPAWDAVRDAQNKKLTSMLDHMRQHRGGG